VSNLPLWTGIAVGGVVHILLAACREPEPEVFPLASFPCEQMTVAACGYSVAASTAPPRASAALNPTISISVGFNDNPQRPPGNGTLRYNARTFPQWARNGAGAPGRPLVAVGRSCDLANEIRALSHTDGRADQMPPSRATRLKQGYTRIEKAVLTWAFCLDSRKSPS
jgi:hypothetical protein